MLQAADCLIISWKLLENCLKGESDSEYIIYKNSVFYAATNGMSFFSKFDLSCKITNVVDVDMAQLDLVSGMSLIGNMEDEFKLNEYAALVIDGSPEGI